jgi:NAD(P)H-dependent flavin oxidoreductase YrpB (nitropropane dioxygenase family)
MRTKFEGSASSHQTQGGDAVQRDSGAARAISSFIDPSLSWKDLPFLIECSGDMKIILKGVQCWEDAVLAAEAGVDGIVLSNHGGRQLDTAPAAITILAEVVGQLNARGLMYRPGKPKFEIFVDGGVRRATDVLKAVALGATAVGIGRPMIYAMSTYGQEGVAHALQILKVSNTCNKQTVNVAAATGYCGYWLLLGGPLWTGLTPFSGRVHNEHAPYWRPHPHRRQPFYGRHVGAALPFGRRYHVLDKLRADVLCRS